MFEEGYSRGVTRYDFGTNELHYKKFWGAKYLDRMDTFTVSTNRIVAGFLKAGIKLKGLLNGSTHSDRHVSGEPLPTSSRHEQKRLKSALAEAEKELTGQTQEERETVTSV